VARPAVRPLLAAALLVLSAASASARPSGDPDCPVDGYDDKCEAWIAIEDDPDGAAPAQNPTDLAVSPTGSTVYLATQDVSGSGFNSKSRWAITARDAANGAVRWSVREGAPTEYAFPTGIEVSPDGSRVYVTGTRRTSYNDPNSHLTTRAFDAASGAELWTATYDGPGNGTDNARDLVVSPDGREIYIAGISGAGGNLDFAAIAYDAATGDELWVTRYNGPGNGVDSPFDVALSADGGTLVLAGWSDGAGEFNIDFGTVAFRTRGADPGAIKWVARYDKTAGSVMPERANAVAISPDGSTVFVGGTSGSFQTNDYRFATVAYDAATGQQRWESLRNWEGTDFDEITAMAMAPNGAALYVTGQSTANRQSDIATVAYNPLTGQELWNMREAAPEHHTELGKDIVATSNGVYVTGLSIQTFAIPSFANIADISDQVTVSYTSAGAKRWIARLNTPAAGVTIGRSMDVGGGRLFVAGDATDNLGTDSDIDDAVLAAYNLP
jgi:hypothetical protein